MNEKEAYEFIAGKFGMTPDMVPYLVEVGLEQTIINPMLPESILHLGRLLDLRPGLTILDLACGKGGVTLPLVHTYKVRLTGVDIMPDFIREAWSRAEYTGLAEFCLFHNENAAAYVAGVKGRQWDAVFCLGAMPHIWGSLEEGLAAARPLVKPGGHLVIGEAYLKPGTDSDPEGILESREATEARLARFGRIVEAIDDGDRGWEAYSAPQKKAIAKMKAEQPGNRLLQDFLESWSAQMDWEIAHIGFAVWVLKVE